MGVLLLGGGCHTALGRYLGDRARDFGEVFRLEAGGAIGLGVVVEAGGLAHAGLGGGVGPCWVGAGWSYGTGHAFIGRPHAVRARSVHVALPHRPLPVGPARWVGHLRQSPPYGALHTCWGLLPALFGESIVATGNSVARVPLWSTAALREPTVLGAPPGATRVDGIDLDRERLLRAHRWNHVHAFDVSVDVWAGCGHVAAGVSLGELADFLLGWFGLDLAGDDRAGGGP